MKILEVTRSFYPSIGGMEKFVSDRLKIYTKLGYNYQVITTTHSEKSLTSKTLKEVIYLPSFTPYEIVPSLSKTMELNYDILSLNQISYYYSLQAVETAWRMGKKIILTPHFYFHTKKFQFIKSLHNKFVVPKILEKVDRIICFTEHESDYWKSAFPFVKNKIVIIPHYFNQPVKIKIKRKNDYGNFLLFLGRGEENKRIDLLIKAFTKIDTKYHLILTLDEDEILPELKDIIKNDKRIHLLGRVTEEEKQNLLSTCSALILPSDFEAFGIVNFEASFYKKPLIISNLKVFKDILTPKGVLFFENNVNSILNNINKFLKISEAKKSEMGDANFENLQRYSFNKTIQKYSSLFT